MKFINGIKFIPLGSCFRHSRSVFSSVGLLFVVSEHGRGNICKFLNIYKTTQAIANYIRCLICLVIKYEEIDSCPAVLDDL